MNTQDMFRSELKFICSNAELSLIETRLKNVISIDAHALSDGEYSIRSLYFDDFDNSCFYEVEDGNNNREKYRIRIYNQNPEIISLELKGKENGKNQKQICRMSARQCRNIIDGKLPDINESGDPLMKKFCIEYKTRLLRPKIIVDYTRKAFIHSNGNVRITFDKYISSSADFKGFFEKSITKIPVMPTGQHILEVKYDEFLPGFIFKQLNLQTLDQTAFSKYYICRQYERQRGILL